LPFPSTPQQAQTLSCCRYWSNCSRVKLNVFVSAARLPRALNVVVIFVRRNVSPNPPWRALTLFLLGARAFFQLGRWVTCRREHSHFFFSTRPPPSFPQPLLAPMKAPVNLPFAFSFLTPWCLPSAGNLWLFFFLSW